MTYNKQYTFVYYILIGLAILYSSMFSKVFAVQGDTIITGEGTESFNTNVRHFPPNLDLNQTINACNIDCSANVKMSIGAFLQTYFGPKEPNVLKIVQTHGFYIRTHADGRLYWLDGTSKTAASWQGLGGGHDARVKAIFEAANRKTGGLLAAGGKFGGTTLIYGSASAYGGPPTKQLPPPSPIIECTPGQVRHELVARGTDAGNGYVSGVQSVYAVINPVRPRNFSKLSREEQYEWEKTHKTQQTTPILTPYGKYLQDNASTLRRLRALGKEGGIGSSSEYRRTWERFAAGAQRAIAQGVPEVNINFSNENQKGFSRGGAFTFTEMRKTATVSTSHKQDLYDRYTCISDRKSVLHEGVYVMVPWYHWSKTASRIIIDGQYTANEVVVRIAGNDYRPYISYQLLNVRCNKDEFDRIVANTGSSIITTGSGFGSATARSRNVHGSVATFFNNLSVDFYYNGNSCDPILGCTAESDPSSSNDRRNNLGSRGVTPTNRYGAQVDGQSDSRFTFFRDNVSKVIRNDVWYLTPRGYHPEVVTSTLSDAAQHTFVTLDKRGTPAKELVEFGDRNENKLLDGKQISSTKNFVTFSNQQNVFTWKASWASEADKPHGMNIRYAYKPKIQNTGLQTLNRDNVSTNVQEFEIDILCDVSFNTHAITPTIVKNGPKPYSYEPVKNFNDDNDKKLTVTFVKSSVE